MTFSLTEIQPALRDPEFDLSKVILLLALPSLGIQDCRAVTQEVALQIIKDCTTRVITDLDLARWSRELSRVTAEGLVPIIRLSAVEHRAWITIDGVEITPTAKA